MHTRADTTGMKTAAEAKASLFALEVLVPHPRESVNRETHSSGTHIGSDSSEGRPRADLASMARCSVQSQGILILHTACTPVASPLAPSSCRAACVSYRIQRCNGTMSGATASGEVKRQYRDGKHPMPLIQEPLYVHDPHDVKFGSC